MTTLTPEELAGLRAKAEAATPIPMAPGYAATADGTILSTASNWRGYGARALGQQPNDDGYPSVRVMIDGKRKHIAVHRLMSSAFLPPRPSPLHEIRHLDGDKNNRARDNLAWGTVAENAADRKMHGTERAAENGRKSAWKLVGRYRPLCLRGHDKEGRRSCEQCRRERRARASLATLEKME